MTFDSKELFNQSLIYDFVFMEGDNQSGKTSLFKTLVKKIVEDDRLFFIPIFFSSSDNFEGPIISIIARQFKNQYFVDNIENTNEFIENNLDRIILFFDDFHKIKNKKNVIGKINSTKVFKVFCSIDIIYSLNFEMQFIKNRVLKISIKELSPIKRDELIRNWLELEDYSYDESEKIEQIDKKTRLIEEITNKSINGGIMPAYPFLILSIISNTETLNNSSLDNQITSQGHCYEALIIIAFAKIGLKKDYEISGCMNFLSELAYKMFSAESYEMASDIFENFIDGYEKRISLPFNRDKFVKKLIESHLITRNLGNIRFNQKYAYYYFVASYFSNSGNCYDEIEKICKNVHKDENAYILIFYSHKNKSLKLIDILLKEAESIFANEKPITLGKNEMDFFKDEYISHFVNNIKMPNESHNHEIARRNRLENRVEKKYDDYEDDSDLLLSEHQINLRKSIKLAETIGMVAKNRWTSIEKDVIKNLLKAAINLNLRELNSFFNLFRDELTQNELISLFEEFIKDGIRENNKIKNDEDCKEYAKKIFWGLNFFYLFAIINITIQSIGSEGIISFIDEIIQEKEFSTPAFYLIAEGSRIRYANNLDKKNLYSFIDNKNNSNLAKNILRILVVEYCKTHPVRFDDKQQIGVKMKINIDNIKH